MNQIIDLLLLIHRGVDVGHQVTSFGYPKLGTTLVECAAAAASALSSISLMPSNGPRMAGETGLMVLAVIGVAVPAKGD